MRKGVVILIIALAAAAGVSAQSRVQLGVRAGITSRDMSLRITDIPNADLTTDSRLGYHIAAAARVRLSAVGRGALGIGLFVQPEIVYSQNIYRMQEGSDPVTRIRMQSIEIPVLLSVKVSLIRVNAGPVINAMYKTDTARGGLSLMSQKPSVGYSIGASVDLLAGLVLDGRYNGQFKQLQNNIQGGKNVYDSVKGSLGGWSLGLSWFF